MWNIFEDLSEILNVKLLVLCKSLYYVGYIKNEKYMVLTNSIIGSKMHLLSETSKYGSSSDVVGLHM